MKWQKSQSSQWVRQFLFSKFLERSMDEIADGRGFEPLFFHIQGEFSCQRPFSAAGQS
jgi:hypothetical protein